MFRYSLTLNGVSGVCDPAGTEGAKVTAEKGDNQIFFRRKWSGELKFRKNDFARLYAAETSPDRCKYAYLNVERECEGGWKPFWPGKFSLNKVNWDLDNCVATVQPDINDLYTDLMENYNREFNILEVPPTTTVSTKLDFDGQFEFMSIHGGTISDEMNPDTWMVFLEMRHWIKGTAFQVGLRQNTDVIFRLVTYRTFTTEFAPELDGWTIIEEDIDKKKAKYAKKPDLYNFKPYRWGSDAWNKYPELRQIQCGAAFDTSRFIKVTLEPGGKGNDCFNIRERVTRDRYVNIIWEFGRFNFNRNRRLLAAIKFLLKRTAPNLEPDTEAELSQFFSTDINYATGEANKVKDILIAQKSDIMSWNSSERASKGLVSLRKLMDELNFLFQGNLFWFINNKGKFQIEHRSYFEFIGKVDLVTPKFQKYLHGKLKYTYREEDMPRFEKLTCPDTINVDFHQGIIEYSGACVNYAEGSDTDEKVVTLFTNDIEHLVTATGENKSGFVLITHKNGEIIKERGEITGELLANGHLAAANIVKHYSNHGRVLWSALVNNKATVFKSIRKSIAQTPLTISDCCGDFSPYAEYITNLGNQGEMASSEVVMKNGTITLNVLFDKTNKQEFPIIDPENPEANPPRPWTDQWTNQFG